MRWASNLVTSKSNLLVQVVRLFFCVCVVVVRCYFYHTHPNTLNFSYCVLFPSNILLMAKSFDIVVICYFFPLFCWIPSKGCILLLGRWSEKEIYFTLELRFWSNFGISLATILPTSISPSYNGTNLSKWLSNLMFIFCSKINTCG